jgi:hypothetical protein
MISSVDDSFFVVAFFVVAIILVGILLLLFGPPSRVVDPPDDLYWLTLPGLRARYKGRSKHEKAAYLNRVNSTGRLVFALFVCSMVADVFFDQDLLAAVLAAVAIFLCLRAFFA